MHQPTTKIIELIRFISGPIFALSAGMKTVIIVSKCLRVTKFNPHESTYEFHFKGVCAGEALRKVVLIGRHDFLIKKGEEYLMYVQMVAFEEGTLKGHILKAKPLDECWDKS
jgi:hypothetical protein